MDIDAEMKRIHKFIDQHGPMLEKLAKDVMPSHATAPDLSVLSDIKAEWEKVSGPLQEIVEAWPQIKEMLAAYNAQDPNVGAAEGPEPAGAVG